MNNFLRKNGMCPLSLLMTALWTAPSVWGQSSAELASRLPESTTELQERWEYFVPVPLPAPEPGVPADGRADGAPFLVDVILGPKVFSHARTDLADLRLYDTAGKTIPYALRILRPQSVRDRVATVEFNRSEQDAAIRTLTLDLQQDDIQHNEIQIETTGDDFRRAVEVEGSEEGKTWQRLVAAKLIRFSGDGQKFDLDSFSYPDSRFRYVRVRVQPDPNPGSAADECDDFEISDVKILRHLEVPGERLTLEATIEPRAPVRISAFPGSAWIIDLGGDNVPCDRIEVDVTDSEFVRNISIEAEYPSDPPGRAKFLRVALSGDFTWQRKSGDPKKPMVAEFTEIQASRLKLLVTDYRNPPLTIGSVKFSAPARQLVFARPGEAAGEPKLYFGNPHAELPNYDFARNLPAKLSPPPSRAVLGEAEPNPSFVPPPQPFTERLPWLIYVVLGSVTAVLAVVILNLSRIAIAIHDANNKDARSGA